MESLVPCLGMFLKGSQLFYYVLDSMLPMCVMPTHGIAIGLAFVIKSNRCLFCGARD